MNPQERKIIDDLFDKLAQAERQTGPREPTAEAHIHARMHAQPGAPYLMAQTIVMQMQALEAAQSRIASLEDELARRPAGGGFLSGLFGGGLSPGEPAPTPGTFREPGVGSRSPGLPIGQTPHGPAGGGFLAGAAQTAMGVAGGLLLGSLVGSFLGGDEAHASQGGQTQPEATPDGAEADLAGDAAENAWDEET